MAIRRYKLALPNRRSNEFQGFMISNFDTLERGGVPEYFSRPPIRVTLLDGNRDNLVDCLVGAKGAWISDMKEQVIVNGIAGWRLTEVEFRRRSPRLGFRTDGAGVENLYIADDVAAILAFEVYRGDNLPPYVYTVDHRWQLFDPKGRSTYLTANVEESVGGKVLRRIEFDLSHNPKDRTSEFYAKHPERCITITELC